MAKITRSEIINDIRNSIGSKVYSIWKGKAYTRNKAVVVTNPNSPDQIKMRQRLAVASKRWYSTLTDDQRNKWNEWAQSYDGASKSNSHQGRNDIIPSNRRVFTGYNAYCLINGLKRSTGSGQWIDNPPLGIDGPTQPLNLEVEYITKPRPGFDLTWTDPPNLPDNSMIRVWLRSWDIAHRQQLGTAKKGEEFFRITSFKGKDGKRENIIAGNFSFQIDAVTPDGLKSAGSQIVSYNIPTPPPPITGYAIQLGIGSAAGYASVPYIPASSVTIEAFVKPNTERSPILAYGFLEYPSIWPSLDLDILIDRRIRAWVHDQDIPIDYILNSTIALDQDVVYHVALTYNDITHKLALFINGIKDGEIDAVYHPRLNSDALRIGRTGIPTMLHTYDEIRWSSMVRYPANFTPPSEPFVADENTLALYHCDENGGTILRDSGQLGLDANLEGAYSWVTPLV